jgi:hypothetical protein
MDMQEKIQDARESLANELKTMYASKISAEKKKIDRDKKFVDSIDDCEVSKARVVLKEFQKRSKSRDLVLVKINKKTSVYAPKEKCYQDEDGNWHKKNSETKDSFYVKLKKEFNEETDEEW